jgi:hypothetical protein
MAKQTINIGAAPNDGTGTPLRTSFDYCNQNFTELYTATGPSGNNIVVPGTATISGNLTVDTNTLFVDSANDRVGVGTTSPAVRLNVADADNAANGTIRLGVGAIYSQIKMSASSTGRTDFTNVGNGVNGAYNFSIEGQDQYRIATSGVFSWYDGAGGTRMTLNSTGLGVGRSPSYKLDIAGVGNFEQVRVSNAAATNVALVNTTSGLTYTIYSANTASNGFNGFGIFDGSSYVMQISASGNVGIGQTPSDKFNVRVSPASGAFGGMTVNDSTNVIGLMITGSAYSSFGVGANSGWLYAATNNMSIGPYGSGYVNIVSNGAERIRFAADGNAYMTLQGAVPTIPNNAQMVFNLTSNTNLRISVKGSDGTTRVANITLA